MYVQLMEWVPISVVIILCLMPKRANMIKGPRRKCTRDVSHIYVHLVYETYFLLKSTPKLFPYATQQAAAHN